MKKLITIITLVALMLITARWYFYPDLYELNLKIAKYTELNINKNSGWKVQVLKVLDLARVILPEYQPVHIQRDDSALGYESALFSNHRQEEEWRFIFEFSNNSDQNSIIIENMTDFKNAVKTVTPGSTIYLAAGQYFIKDTLDLEVAGTESKPIRLQSLNPQQPAELIINTQEGLLLKSPYWTISNLIFSGDCEFDDYCEHAIHLAGNAKYTVIKDNRFKNFNAHIKANGNYRGQFPDFVLIENNNFVNEWVRETKNPVTPIDVVGGSNWIIKQNFIADFAKQNKSRMSVSYGAFLKGAGRSSLFEDNFIACSWRLEYQSALDIRVGVSLGGGGTDKRFCRDETCEFEYAEGKINNNTILNCSDVGIYLNKAMQSVISGNLLLSTLGIDARFPSTTAEISGNSLDGRIKSRDEASAILIDNQILTSKIDSLDAN